MRPGQPENIMSLADERAVSFLVKKTVVLSSVDDIDSKDYPLMLTVQGIHHAT
jgi:hypothetical protein